MALATVSALVRWASAAAVITVLAGVVSLSRVWPDWDALAQGAVPPSSVMLIYEARRERFPQIRPLNWSPVDYEAIPPHVVRAVLIAEDGRFFEHHGLDWRAIRAAAAFNLREGRVVFGASTISQQTAKNLFLGPERTFLRKWQEAVLASVMERRLDKRRILEIYLNVAQLGPGVFGVDAAARVYYGRPVQELDTRQAAELAATLPAPLVSNPRTRSRFFVEHADSVHERLLSVLGRRRI